MAAHPVRRRRRKTLVVVSSPFGRPAAEAAATEEPEAADAVGVHDPLSPGDPDFLGRLETSKHWWDIFARDAFVREAVRGHKLEFESRPPVSSPDPPQVIPMSREKQVVLQKEVDSLLRKGAIEKVKDSHKGFYSNLFLMSKKDGGLRPVINLSGLNLYIQKKTFRIASLKDVSQTLRKGDWAVTIDLKDAYLHVPIASEHRRFLRFWWRGNKFQFRRHLFGLSSAPQTFTRLTWPLVTLCRANGVRVIVYLDDFLVLVRNKAELTRHTAFVLVILRRAGFQRNPKKCHLEPRQQQKKKSFSGSCSEIPRQGRLCSTGSTAREVTTATPSDGGDTGLEIRQTDSGQRIQAFNQMVDTPSDRRDGPEVLHSAAVNDYRCFQFRVGSDSGRQVGQRQMVCGREGHPHQPFGTVGDVQGSQELQTSSEEQESDGPFGQHHCNSPPFQRRRNTFGAFEQVDDGDPVVLQKPWSGSDSCFSPRDCESRSGRPIPREGDQQMVHQSDSDETDVQTVRSSTDRSLRFKQIAAGRGDLLFIGQKRQAIRWDERSEPDLGVQPDVCFPASTDHPFDTGQDERVQGDIDSSHPLLVQGSLVTRTPADVSSGASTPTSASEYSERPDHRPEPAIFAEAQADSMAYLWNTFQNQGMITPWRSSGEILERFYEE